MSFSLKTTFHLHQAHLEAFYATYPMCKLALFFALGIGTCFFPLTLLLLPLLLPRTHSLILITLLIIGCVHAHMRTKTPTLRHPIKGSALLYIETSFQTAHPIFTKTLFKGRIKAFISEENQAFHNLPILFEKNKFTPHVKVGATYFIEQATVSQSTKGYYLTLNKTRPPKLIKPPSLVARFKARCQHLAKKQVMKLSTHTMTRSVLLASLLGISPNALIKAGFQKAGLSHLLCISGFHLVLAFSLLYFLLHKLLTRSWSLLITLTLIAFYALILLPSTMALSRAFLALLLYVFGQQKALRPSPLNLLGAITLITLLLDPSALLQIGFQLSYIATFALLWMLPTFEHYCETLWPSPPLSVLAKRSIMSQLMTLLAQKLKMLCLLSLALDLFTLPLIIYHFGSFSLLGCFYNLFAPLLFALLLTLAYTCCLISLALPWLLPLISKLLTPLFTLFCHLVLFAPKKLSTPLFLHLLSPMLPLACIATLFYLSLPLASLHPSKNSLSTSVVLNKSKKK